MKPGVVLVLVTPDAGSLVSRAMGSRWLEMKRAPEHLQFFTVAGLARMLTLSGFTPYEWHSMGKISTVRTMLADLRFYSARMVDMAERALARARLADVVIDLDPRTKFCIYARKSSEPAPLDQGAGGAVAAVPRVKTKGMGRAGLRRAAVH